MENFTANSNRSKLENVAKKSLTSNACANCPDTSLEGELVK